MTQKSVAIGRRFASSSLWEMWCSTRETWRRSESETQNHVAVGQEFASLMFPVVPRGNENGGSAHRVAKGGVSFLPCGPNGEAAVEPRKQYPGQKRISLGEMCPGAVLGLQPRKPGVRFLEPIWA